MFAEHVIRNASSKETLEKVRALVSKVYDYEYLGVQELYGTTNDIDGRDMYDTEEYENDSPFQQVDPRQSTRPYVPPPEVRWDGNSFAGFDPPMG